MFRLQLPHVLFNLLISLVLCSSLSVAHAATRAAVGVFRNGTWFLDANANGAWDGCGTEFCFTGFGQAGDMPVR